VIIAAQDVIQSLASDVGMFRNIILLRNMNPFAYSSTIRFREKKRKTGQNLPVKNKIILAGE
jgi:hypothetical protein